MAKPSLAYQRLRAPRHDGELLLAPSAETCLLLPNRNRQHLASITADILGQPYQNLREECRQSVLRIAHAFTSQYTDVDLAVDSQDQPSIIMSGHQPQLFHPGVWCKNFLIDTIAKRTGAVAVQVVIDNDTMRSSSIRVPSGSRENPIVVSQAFDAHTESLPFERRFVADRSIAGSFAQRVSESISGLVPDPLIHQLWPLVLEAVDAELPLGQSIARARHQLELACGVRTLEVPLSQLCDTRPFRRFALHLLGQMETVHETYNRRLAEYRKVHRLRSDAQPMPDLKSSGDWLETPFWYWTIDDPRRRALWMRRAGSDIEIGVPNENWTLSDSMRSPEQNEDELSSHRAAGFCLRPRALTNTMFLRLFASDCFVHGIGGAKYDQITDLLIQDLYGFLPPETITASQTTWLPVEAEWVDDAQILRQQELLRDMFQHPERHIIAESRTKDQVSSLLETKKMWIKTDLPRGRRLERHRAIAAANESLRGYLQEKTEKQKKVLSDLQSLWGASRILTSREWSFCLFPYSFLTTRLLDLKFNDS